MDAATVTRRPPRTDAEVWTALVAELDECIRRHPSFARRVLAVRRHRQLAAIVRAGRYTEVHAAAARVLALLEDGIPPRPSPLALLGQLVFWTLLLALIAALALR